MMNKKKDLREKTDEIKKLSEELRQLSDSDLDRIAAGGILNNLAGKINQKEFFQDQSGFKPNNCPFANC